MKRKFICLVLCVLATVTACYEDTGNYDYRPAEIPAVTGLEGETFVAYVGDSLIITPAVGHSLLGTEQLTFEWSIDEITELRDYKFEGKDLRIQFGFSPGMHDARYTITDHANGMKYFYEFTIEARTEFTTGIIVLSSEDGHSRLTFIKPDGTVQPNLYAAIHEGEALPDDPLQLEYVDFIFVPGADYYYILCGEEDNPGVILDPNTLSRLYYLSDRFFDTPSPLKARHILPTDFGVTLGIYNDKLHAGTQNTFYGAPIYGTYGDAIPGDYVLAPYLYAGGGYYLGFDRSARRFIWFNPVPYYAGTGYATVYEGDGDDFDPANVGMDLIGMMSLSSEVSYAFCKDDDGNVYEFKFYFVPGTFFPKYKRPFAGSALVDENTQWQGSSLEILYFTSGDKIYRYNPVNEEVKALEADFGGKQVTMIQLVENGTVLMAGVEGELHTLDVSTGRNGNIVNTITDIPGAPVDIVIRE